MAKRARGQAHKPAAQQIHQGCRGQQLTCACPQAVSLVYRSLVRQLGIILEPRSVSRYLIKKNRAPPPPLGASFSVSFRALFSPAALVFCAMVTSAGALPSA